MIRRGLVLTTCLLGLASSPAWAEGSSALDDIVDGVGGVLKVLVGPPISSPSPYLNLPGTQNGEAKPAETVAAPPPSVPPPAAPPSVIVVPAVQPAPAAVPAPAPTLPPVKAAAPVAPPPPKPAPPAAIKASAPVPETASPVEPPQPACLRAAATATIEQMRRLPSCK